LSTLQRYLNGSEKKYHQKMKNGVLLKEKLMKMLRKVKKVMKMIRRLMRVDI